MNGINTNAMNAMVNGTNGVPRTLENFEEMKTKLNTCIYDYFLRNEQWDLARSLHKSQLNTLTAKTAPPRKTNGEENGEDMKDDLDAKKPGDLPYPQEIPAGATDNSFLLDWFQLFWEIFLAPRKVGTMKQSPQALAYLNQQKEQQIMVRQGGIPGQMMPNYPPGMMRPVPGAMNMVGRNAPTNPNMRNVNQAVAAQQQREMMLRQQQQQQQAMIQNQQSMAREGSDIDMTDPNMIGQNQFNNFQGQNNKKDMIAAYSQNVTAQTIRQSMPNSMQGQVMGGQAGMEEFYNPTGAMRGQMPGNGQQGQGNHALQDYQMQLMLLEQQNKKRLLMARQEQDQVRPGEQGMGAQAGFAPNMSPQGSRSGPSPNPSDQMKRATPKMAQPGLPGGDNSPMPDSNMVHARNSPGAMGFNGVEMMQQGMKGVDGMPIPPGMRPPTHAGYNGVPQMDAIRAAQRNGQMPNGAGGWSQMGQGQTPGMPQGPQPGQQMGTPRNANMPPPPVQNGANGRPGSPAQSAAAGTPQPGNKAAPVKKGKAGKDTKKQPQKKGPTAATPSADDNPPQTPTPATPITPMHPSSFNKDGKNINGAQATTGQINNNISAPAAQAPQPQQDNMLNHFEPMDGLEHGSLNMHFGGIDTGDVLEQFDFDAFLDTGENDINFDNMNYGAAFDGLESGTGDV